jgi:molybdopterin molybdotransferase
VGLMPVAEALSRVLVDARPLPAEPAALMDTRGRVLSSDIVALRSQPPADVSAMDGYAVRAADVATAPARLEVIGEVAAGHPFARTVGAGEAVRIFTGGLLPAGADTVVIQENTTVEGRSVLVSIAADRGKHVRVEGLDFKRGAVLLTKGRRLSDRDLALAAAMNHPRLPVHRRPKLAFFASGDELVMPGSELAAGEIVHSNAYAILAMARREGCELIDLGIVPDRLDATAEAVRHAGERRADILVTSGGASVGDYDLVHKALASEGLALSFWKVAMRPGRPMLHGRLDQMHVLGLPGNPVSAYVCSLLFLVPLIRQLCGQTEVAPASETAILGRDLPENDERADYLRARLCVGAGGVLIAMPAPVQDSSMLTPLAEADCLLIREPHAPAVAAGSRCNVLRLPL